MVKYAAALKLGAADTEDTLRRFRRSNVLFSTSFSKLSSDTSRFSFEFSYSNSFSRRAWSILKPPYSLRQR